MIRIFAVLVTIIGSSMAGVAAWGRGGTFGEQFLIIAISVFICMGTHFLLALSRSKIAWFLWAGCLVGAAYNNVVFFSTASIHAGDKRAMNSVQVIGTREQIAAIHNALAVIEARPVTIVASELSSTHEYRQKIALKAELAESRRAVLLRDELVRLTGVATTSEVAASKDPVASLLAKVTNSSERIVTLVVGVGFSILMELVGALLWYEVIRRQGRVISVNGSQAVVRDPVTSLKEAVTAGACKPTVAGIRRFMGCSQARAMELRRMLN